jgi:hypothetical protein
MYLDVNDAESDINLRTELALGAGRRESLQQNLRAIFQSLPDTKCTALLSQRLEQQRLLLSTSLVQTYFKPSPVFLSHRKIMWLVVQAIIFHKNRLKYRQLQENGH